MNRPLIDQAVDRFLGWKLPEDFSPDGGVSFQPLFNIGTPYQAKHTPSGTNLLSGVQAKAMLEYVVAPLLDRIKELENREKDSRNECRMIELPTKMTKPRLKWTHPGWSKFMVTSTRITTVDLIKDHFLDYEDITDLTCEIIYMTDQELEDLGEWDG